jgi:amino acid transporter
MKKRSELIFSAFQVPMDMIMIFLAALSAFMIRNIPQIIALQPKLYKFPLKSYLIIVLFVIPIFILVYALEGLYDLKVTRKFWKEALKVFLATSIGLVAIIVAIFLKREWFSHSGCLDVSGSLCNNRAIYFAQNSELACEK